MENISKKELIEYFLTENKSGYKTKENHILKKFNGLLDEINNHIINSEYDTNISFTQKLYNYLYDIKIIQKCDACNKPIKWKNRFSEGYRNNCSVACKHKSKKRLEKMYKTNIDKYNVKHFLQNDKLFDKRKKTIKDKYGVDNIFIHPEIIKKTKLTNFKIFGVEYPIQSEIIKTRIKENYFLKYGVNNYCKSKEYKNKIYEKTINNFAIKLKLSPSNIQYDGEFFIIRNYCKKHVEFEIRKYILHNRLLYGIDNICTECNPISENSSIKEKEVRDFIENDLNIKTEKIKINNKEIDIYLPEYKLGIEFNGLYWHSNKFKEDNYHLNKTELCEKQGIHLLHVFEDEWIFKKEIVKSIIKSKLGLISNKIYARKTEVKEIIDNKLIRDFLNNNHIQGFVGSKVKLGLFYNNELVSLMTFGKKRILMGVKKNVDGEYEMLRFCNKMNTNVVGGASKLLKYFIKTYQPKSILTYANRRYSNGNLYEKLGFYKIKNTEPNYWYFKTNDLIRHYRFKFRKNILIKEGYNSNKTEKQIMIERKYYIIYDCGNIKFEKLIK